MAYRRGQIADFRDSFETINWLYLLFKCGIKTKTHFEWLLWHWSSLGQLNLEPTRPNGLVGCKVPTDLVKLSVKEATHMGFHYRIMYVLEWRTVSALTRGLFWCLFPELRSNEGNKYQNNTRVSPETVRHESTYIILFLTRHNESI